MPKSRILDLLKGAVLPEAEERKALAAVAGGDPRTTVNVLHATLQHRRILNQELKEAHRETASARAALEALRQPPWLPAIVLRAHPDGRVEVFAGGRRQILTAVPEVDMMQLSPGCEVFLNADMDLVVGRNTAAEPVGLVGTVAEVDEGRVVLQSVADEALVAACPPELLETLETGDRVVHLRDHPCIVARLKKPERNTYLLETPPGVDFDAIGGHDDVIAEMRRDLDLHLLHAERVADFQLPWPGTWPRPGRRPASCTSRLARCAAPGMARPRRASASSSTRRVAPPTSWSCSSTRWRPSDGAAEPARRSTVACSARYWPRSTGWSRRPTSCAWEPPTASTCATRP
jgi:hypothetical protein